MRTQLSNIMALFANNRKLVQELLDRAREVSKGKTISEVGINPSYIAAYGAIARRCRDDKDFGVTPYPYEQCPGVAALTGGFFEHRDWPLRKHMERHNSLRAVYEYEANYINSAGYWMSFHEAALDLRSDSIEEKKDNEAKLFDLWAAIAIRYGLRVVGLRAEFYRMAAIDPTYAKMIMPTLEPRNEIAAADDLKETMEKLDTHMTTQLMKEVATLNASNSTKKARNGGSAGRN